MKNKTVKNLLIAAALAPVLILGACNNSETAKTAEATEDTAVLANTGENASDMATNTTGAMQSEWDSIDYDLPEVALVKDGRKDVSTRGKNLPEVNVVKNSKNDVSMRGNDRVATYGLGENVIFESGKAIITQNGASNLSSVNDNIEEKFSQGKVKIYGFTDTVGSVSFNKDLAKDRAESVKQWFIGHGIMGDRITMSVMGEKNPIPGGNNADDRRVVIVAKK